MKNPHHQSFRVDNSATGDISSAGRNVFFAAVETTRMPMLITDPSLPDNPIIFANKAFVEMTGYTSEELLGTNCRFLQGKETDRDTVAAVREAIAAEREIAVEIINYRKDGTAFWNALFISPVRNEDGKLIYFFASQLDVSRRRDAEEGLRQAQKMEALGQLTGGIAHDFNNLLQVMMGYLDSIQRNVDKPDFPRSRIRDSAEHALSAAERASRLTQQLLAFSRKQTLTGRVINLNNIVKASQEMSGSVLEGVRVNSHLEPQLLNCRIDPTQIELALLNIFVNSRDALVGRDKPTITIETKNHRVEGAQTSLLNDLQPGQYVSLSVTDNGCGMSQEVATRVMDPFFTTKDEGKGTGLGLSMVYGFAKQSGGAARVYSEENIGTTIRLYFPAIDSGLTQEKQQDSTGPRLGTERILIVEDREDVAQLAKMMLEDEGFTTEVAYNAREALAIMDKADFDMLFTDLIMPGGMNGVSLAREARRRDPSIKILLTTGYSENSIERTGSGGEEFEVLSKPYLPNELAKKVRVVLDGPTGVG